MLSTTNAMFVSNLPNVPHYFVCLPPSYPSSHTWPMAFLQSVWKVSSSSASVAKQQRPVLEML